ncbi:MAG: cupredoxin domain-containing protein [Candidatus Binataceae bacterium]
MLSAALLAALILLPASARSQPYSKLPSSRQIQSALEHLPSHLITPPSNPNQAQPASSRKMPSVIVEMNDELPMYEPSHLTITTGDTVEWKNNGIVDHSASDNAQKADNKSDAKLPAGATPFYSGAIMPGHVYRYTFTVPGAYKYFCDSHESDGMIGEITVHATPETPEAESKNSPSDNRPLTRVAQDPPR